jgi:hypothetical protein
MDGFLLVDDRDGAVLAEVGDPVEALQLLDGLKDAHPELVDALCLVTFGRATGSLVATASTTRIRTLDLNSL